MFNKIISLLQQVCKSLLSFYRSHRAVPPASPASPADKDTDQVPENLCPLTPATDYAEIHKALKNFLQARYQLRYNLLTGQAEVRPTVPQSPKADFQPIDRRKLNTLVIEARDEGIPCWDKDLERLLQSHFMPDFHPFRHYMAHLPVWDGTDRILPLATRIDTDPVWVNGFRHWLLGLTAQWMGIHSRCAHTLTPILISARQGLGKSSFCRLLMPPELKAYYLDKFDLNAQSHLETKLGQFGLINLDEFDRYSKTALATLKNLLQLKEVTVRRAYTSYFVQLERLASFIGTSNQLELLNDPTGSRRFLCIEVTHPIDCSPVDHHQLFAQLKYLIAHGERVWMDQKEETALQEHNAYFNRLHPAEEVFNRIYTLPAPDAEGLLLTTTEIHRTLCLTNPSAMRGISVYELGRTLAAMGLKRVHTREGNKYEVVRQQP